MCLVYTESFAEYTASGDAGIVGEEYWAKVESAALEE